MGKTGNSGESYDTNERKAGESYDTNGLKAGETSDKNGQTDDRVAPQINRVIMKNTEKQPWKIMYMNAERLVTKNSKKKVEYLSEYVEENKVLIMNLTETWLGETVQKDIEIKGYQLYRSDRVGKKGGGAAIYIKEEYEAHKVADISVGYIELLAVYIEKLNILNVVIYRPPDAKKDNFKKS